MDEQAEKVFSDKKDFSQKDSMIFWPPTPAGQRLCRSETLFQIRVFFGSQITWRLLMWPNKVKHTFFLNKGNLLFTFET